MAFSKKTRLSVYEKYGGRRYGAPLQRIQGGQMMDVREKLAKLIEESRIRKTENEGYCICGSHIIADHLIANGVTVQETAHWKDVLDCGVGNCFGICSNCRTQQKAASYASLMTEYRHCRWCGARMVYQPPKGE